MKVPDPIRRIYDYFPLYSFSEANTPTTGNTLHLYSPDTRDPDCLLARAILARYKIPHKIVGSSAYITPSNKLPIFYKSKPNKCFNLSQMIEEFVPVEDRQEPVYMAVLDKLKNAYQTLLEQRHDHTNYLTDRDRKRLWPLNSTINRQTALEAKAAIGYFRTTPQELEIALRALNDLVDTRSGIKIVDMMMFAVLTPLDELIELPRELQREMVRVANELDLTYQQQVTFEDSSILSLETEPVASQS